MNTKRKRNAVEATFGVTDVQYRDWLSYVFDRPTTPNGWYFDVPNRGRLDVTPSEFVSLVGRTMANAEADLTEFSNAQIYFGLNYIFSSPCSDYLYAFYDDKVPLDLKVAALRAMKHLYKDCFEPRCEACLSHLDEGMGNKLNSAAYMLWEGPSLLYANHHIEEVAKAIVEVLDFALYSPNDACIESALHGLGHEARYLPALIDPVIERFLKTTRDAEALVPKGAASLRPIREELRHYARLARRGRVL